MYGRKYMGSNARPFWSTRRARSPRFTLNVKVVDHAAKVLEAVGKLTTSH